MRHFRLLHKHSLTVQIHVLVRSKFGIFSVFLFACSLFSYSFIIVFEYLFKVRPMIRKYFKINKSPLFNRIFFFHFYYIRIVTFLCVFDLLYWKRNWKKTHTPPQGIYAHFDAMCFLIAVQTLHYTYLHNSFVFNALSKISLFHLFMWFYWCRWITAVKMENLGEMHQYFGREIFFLS